MLSGNYFYQVQSKRQELEREIRQRALAKLTFAGRDNRNLYSRDWLVRLGGWLIQLGEYLEFRYSAYNETVVPARSTAKAR